MFLKKGGGGGKKKWELTPSHTMHPWNAIRTICLSRIKICYNLSNHLGSHRNIMQFQTSSRRKNR